MLMAGFVIIFVGIILIICYPINKNKNRRCTVKTQGVLEDIRKRYNSKGRLKDMHVYYYLVDGVEYRLKTTDHNLSVHRVGDACDIWYNPTKPKDAQAFRGSDKYLKTLLIIGIVLTLLGIVVTFFGLVLQ